MSDSNSMENLKVGILVQTDMMMDFDKEARALIGKYLFDINEPTTDDDKIVRVLEISFALANVLLGFCEKTKLKIDDVIATVKHKTYAKPGAS